MPALTRRTFTKGFAKKSFLGSAYPQMRASAPSMDKKFGTNVSGQFKKLKEPKAGLNIRRF